MPGIFRNPLAGGVAEHLAKATGNGTGDLAVTATHVYYANDADLRRVAK